MLHLGRRQVRCRIRTTPTLFKMPGPASMGPGIFEDGEIHSLEGTHEEITFQCGSHLQLLGHFGEKGANAIPLPQLSAFCKGNGIQLGILNVSTDLLYPAAELLERGGVHAIWNFSPVPLAAREGSHGSLTKTVSCNTRSGSPAVSHRSA